MDSPVAQATPPPPTPVVTSRGEFDAALLWAVQTAHARQARRLLLVDTDFADWPLGSAEWLAALQSWLRLPQRRLVLLAAHFDEVPLRHPRFVAWRRHWAHAVEAFSPPPEQGAALPSLLIDDGTVGVQLLDRVHWRGRAWLDAPESRRWREEIDVVLQQSESAFPVQMLGL